MEVGLLGVPVEVLQARDKLAQLLAQAWSPRWIKSPTRRRRHKSAPKTTGRTHTSLHRILQSLSEKPVQHPWHGHLARVLGRKTRAGSPCHQLFRQALQQHAGRPACPDG